MNTIDIDKLLSEDEIAGSLSKGCLPRDVFVEEIPTCPLPALFVFNTQAQTRPGEHWMAAHLAKNKCYYFGS